MQGELSWWRSWWSEQTATHRQFTDKSETNATVETPVKLDKPMKMLGDRVCSDDVYKQKVIPEDVKTVNKQKAFVGEATTNQSRSKSRS